MCFKGSCNQPIVPFFCWLLILKIHKKKIKIWITYCNKKINQRRRFYCCLCLKSIRIKEISQSGKWHCFKTRWGPYVMEKLHCLWKITFVRNMCCKGRRIKTGWRCNIHALIYKNGPKFLHIISMELGNSTKRTFWWCHYHHMANTNFDTFAFKHKT